MSQSIGEAEAPFFVRLSNPYALLVKESPVRVWVIGSVHAPHVLKEFFEVEPPVSTVDHYFRGFLPHGCLPYDAPNCFPERKVVMRAG